MYPKNFIDYKLYIRRLSLPSFISDWFGGKNTCYNKIARAALKDNLDINELLINVCFQVINELKMDSLIRDMLIGNIIKNMLDNQQSFESFKYYKYGEIEYNMKKNQLERNYQSLLDNYHLEMNKVIQEREKSSKLELEIIALKEENALLKEEINLQKNIHDSKDKEINLLNQEMEYKLDEKNKLVNDLQEALKDSVDKRNVLIVDYENQKSKDLTELIDKFECDFNSLKKQRDEIDLCLQITRTERNHFESEYKRICSNEISSRPVNGNQNTSENRDYYRVSETLDAVTKALSMATSELENRCRDNILPRQFTRYTESIELCLSPIGLYKYVNPQYLKDKNRNNNRNQKYNSFSNNQNRSSNYHERRNDNPPSSSSSSNGNRSRNNNNGKYWKPDYIKNSPGIQAKYEEK